MPNSRNGDSRQTVHSNQGSLELQIPRDRRSEFTPVLIPKGQRCLVWDIHEDFDEASNPCSEEAPIYVYRSALSLSEQSASLARQKV
ncbi:transposase [Rubidibacter lacunae]|uniref:transposase n=1 Tax=Rubidibacter lacunae TaxID=582514 RepID=UPI0012EB29BD